MVRVRPNFSRKGVAVPVPPVVSWIITGQCNMRCVHCYPASGPASAEAALSPRELDAAARNLARAGVQSVFLSGGEPLMVPHLVDLVATVRRSGMSCWLCTNGSLVDAKAAERLAAAGLQGVSVSLDSSRSEEHDPFRRTPGAFDKAVRAIRLFRERGVTVNVDYTATARNRAHLGGLQPLAAELGVKSLFLKRFRPLGRGRENAGDLALGLEEYRDCIQTLVGSHRGSGTEICFEDPAVYALFRRGTMPAGTRSDGIYSRFGCLAGLVWIGLQPNGEVTPCPLLKVPIGHILEDDLDVAVARSSLMKRLLDRDDRTGRCGTCAERWNCGGCRAHAFAASGDCCAEDPFCVYSLLEDAP